MAILNCLDNRLETRAAIYKMPLIIIGLLSARIVTAL